MVWFIEGSRGDGALPFKQQLNGDSLVLGRSNKSTVNMNSLAVSRKHCELLKNSTHWIIKDLGTKNGTEVNGIQLPANSSRVLKSGDCVTIAPVVEADRHFKFKIYEQKPQIDDSDDESLSPIKVEDDVLSSDDDSKNKTITTIPENTGSSVSTAEEKPIRGKIVESTDTIDPPNEIETKECIVKKEEASSNYSQEDIVIIDSDDEEFFSPSKKSTKGDVAVKENEEIEEIDIDALELNWGDENNDKKEDDLMSNESDDAACSQAEIFRVTKEILEKDPKPSTSGVRKPRYNLSSSSSSDDDEQINEKSIFAIPRKPAISKPNNKVLEVRQSPKTDVIVKKREEKKSSPKKPAVKQPPRQAIFIATKSIVKNKKKTSLSLRQQITSKYNLPNSTASKQPKRLVSQSKPQQNLNRNTQSRIAISTSSVPPPNTTTKIKKIKPSVPQPINTSRMGFLLDNPKARKTEKPKEPADPIVVRPNLNRDPRLNKPPAVAATTTVTSNPLDTLLPPTSNVQESVTKFISDIRSQSRDKGKVRPRDTEYDINDVIALKRQKREEHERTEAAKPIKPTVENARPVNRQTSRDKETVAAATAALVRQENEIFPLPKCNITAKPHSADSILLQLLSWRPTWVKESVGQKLPPPVSSLPAKKLKQFYESVDEYVKYMSPLIIYETWAQVVEDFLKNDSENDVTANMAFTSCELIHDHFTRLLCHLAIRKNQRVPGEGDLVFVELPFFEEINNESVGRRMMAFGYVADVVSQKITTRTNVENYKIPDGCNELLRFDIRVKRRQLRYDLKFVRVKKVGYVKPMLRNAEALLSLKQSILCEDVLKPRTITCSVVVPTAVKLQSDEYNDSQYKAIIGSVEAISRPFSVPKLLMIQGPPGTGKTHTLIGMIKKMFTDFAKNPSLPKILVCAPSNGAIDEIAKRLIREKNFLCGIKDRQLRLVRIGQQDQIHHDVKIVSLETLVEKNIRSDQVEKKRKIESKLKTYEEKIAALDQEIANFRYLGEVEKAKKSEKQMHRMMTELNVHQKDNKEQDYNRNDDRNKKRMRYDVLRKADVILTTLNSCRQTIIDQVFNTSELNFNCVIVDEATQCTEPEILMPLTYASISKVILIGDPMQLPATVISEVAADNKFGTSLFERFYTYFGGSDPKSPVLMLDTQYRMHPEICLFPSKQFYSGRLKTYPTLNERKFPLRPYVVFNVIDTSHDKNNPKNIFNKQEAVFIQKLYVTICELVDAKTSVGIITPYQGQKKHLEKITTLKAANVQINTIDGFQGQEKDVIILSSVRASEGESSYVGFLNSFQRVNVALTRARHSLIVCLCAKTLSHNDLWKSLIEDAKERNCLINTSANVKIESLKPKLKANSSEAEL